MSCHIWAPLQSPTIVTRWCTAQLGFSPPCYSRFQHACEQVPEGLRQAATTTWRVSTTWTWSSHCRTGTSPRPSRATLTAQPMPSTWRGHRQASAQQHAFHAAHTPAYPADQQKAPSHNWQCNTTHSSARCIQPQIKGCLAWAGSHLAVGVSSTRDRVWIHILPSAADAGCDLTVKVCQGNALQQHQHILQLLCGQSAFAYVMAV